MNKISLEEKRNRRDKIKGCKESDILHIYPEGVMVKGMKRQAEGSPPNSPSNKTQNH